MFTRQVKTKELEAALSSIQSLTIDNRNLVDQVSSLEASMNKIKQQNVGLVEALNNAKCEVEDLTARRLETINELKAASHNLGVSEKLVAKTKADIKDLRESYRATINSQEQQQMLLLELQDQLMRASEYYRQLNFQGQNIKVEFFDDDIEPAGSNASHKDHG